MSGPRFGPNRRCNGWFGDVDGAGCGGELGGVGELIAWVPRLELGLVVPQCRWGFSQECMSVQLHTIIARDGRRTVQEELQKKKRTWYGGTNNAFFLSFFLSFFLLFFLFLFSLSFLFSFFLLQSNNIRFSLEPCFATLSRSCDALWHPLCLFRARAWLTSLGNAIWDRDRHERDRLPAKRHPAPSKSAGAGHARGHKTESGRGLWRRGNRRNPTRAAGLQNTVHLLAVCVVGRLTVCVLTSLLRELGRNSGMSCMNT